MTRFPVKNLFLTKSGYGAVHKGVIFKMGSIFIILKDLNWLKLIIRSWFNCVSINDGRVDLSKSS